MPRVRRTASWQVWSAAWSTSSAPSVPPEVVRRCVTDTAAWFDEASVPNYVPVLVERLARAWLQDAVRESEQRPALRSVPIDVEP